MLPLRLHTISRFAAPIGQIDHQWFCVDSDRISAFVSWIPTIWVRDMVIHDSQKKRTKKRQEKQSQVIFCSNKHFNYEHHLECRMATSTTPTYWLFIAGTKTAFAYPQTHPKLIPSFSPTNLKASKIRSTRIFVVLGAQALPTATP